MSNDFNDIDACTMLRCCDFIMKFVRKHCNWLKVRQLHLLQHACRAQTQDITTQSA